MTPIIMENFLPEPMQDELVRALMGHKFPWKLYQNTNTTDEATQPADSAQFVHGFIQNYKTFSPWATVPQAITTRLGISNDKIIRAKSNIVAREKSWFAHPKHIDDDQPHWVFIYYVNDADGDTLLYEGDEITHRIAPKRGRAVVFDGACWHASSPPVDANFRCIINYNLARDVPEETFRKYAA